MYGSCTDRALTENGKDGKGKEARDTHDGVRGAVDGPEGDVALVQLQRAGPRRGREPERLAAAEPRGSHGESPRRANARPRPPLPPLRLREGKWEQRPRQEKSSGRTRHWGSPNTGIAAGRAVEHARRPAGRPHPSCLWKPGAGGPSQCWAIIHAGYSYSLLGQNLGPINFSVRTAALSEELPPP